MRDHAPAGAPCWADLWTSDVEGSRRFYGELFGWEAAEPSPEFGGYFMFLREGVPVAGGMGPMGDIPAGDFWKIYLQTDDIERTLAAATAAGAELIGGTGVVADLGVQAVMSDSTGAQLGAWQPGSFHGFSVLGEPGAPSWFELHTREHGRAVEFYRSVFGWQTNVVSDSDEFRYTTMASPDGGDDLAGIMDASGFMPAGAPASWSVYWEVDDVQATLANAVRLGGSVTAQAEDTPYGVLASAADPQGASFKLRRTPR